MLPSFRIRNLRRPQSPIRQHFLGALPKAVSGNRDAVVQITGPEYDETVYDHPDAILKYLDDDDGEVVTVGTSLELAQRLEDPAPQSARVRSNSSRAKQSAPSNSPCLPLRPASPNMHVFEIDRRGDSVRIWEEIEQRSRQQKHSEDSNQNMPVPSHDQKQDNGLSVAEKQLSQRHKAPSYEPTSPKLAALGEYHIPRRDDDLSVQVDPADDASRLEELREFGRDTLAGRYKPLGCPLEDARTQHFLASNPPQISTTIQNNPIKDTDAQHGPFPMAFELQEAAQKNNFSLEADHSDNLTLVGKREAIEAGNKLRARATLMYRAEPTQELSSQTKGMNRWATYSGTQAVSLDKPTEFVVSSGILSKEPTLEHGASNDLHQPLLQVFEAELAKLSKETPAISKQEETRQPQIYAIAPEVPSVEEVPSTGNEMADVIRPGRLLVQTVKSLVEGVGALTSELQDQVNRTQASTIPLPNTSSKPIENIFGAIADGFDHCIKAVAQSCYEASNATRLAAEKTRSVDVQAIDSAVNNLKTIAGGVEVLGKSVFLGEATAKSEGHVCENGPVLTNENEPGFVLILQPIPEWAEWQHLKAFVRSHEPNLKNEDENIVTVLANTHMKRTGYCRIRGEKRAWECYRHLAVSTWAGCQMTLSLYHASIDPVLGSSGCHPAWYFGGVIKPIATNAPVKPAAQPRTVSSQYPRSTETLKDPPSKKALQFDANRPTSLNNSSFQRPGASGEQTIPVSMRFDTTVIPPLEARSERSSVHGLGTNRTEPAISYRHIPNPLPLNSPNYARGRQSQDPYSLAPSELPYEYIVSPESDTQRKRRPVPSGDHRRGSRSRSRSPVPTKQQGIIPLHRNQVPLSGQTVMQYNYFPPMQSNPSKIREFHEPLPPLTSITPLIRNQRLSPSHDSNIALSLEHQRQLENPRTSHAGGHGGSLRNWKSHYGVRNRSAGSFRVPVSANLSGPSTHSAPPIPVSAQPQDGSLRHAQSTSALRRPRGFTDIPQHSTQSRSISKERINAPPIADAGTKRPMDPDVNFDMSGTQEQINRPAKGVGSFPKPEDGASSKESSSSSAATRFPSLEQFEGSTYARTPTFPPLPSMEALIPSRPNASQTSSKALSLQASAVEFAKATDPTQTKVYPSAWPQISTGLPEVTESSGEFFRRMTGLDKSSLQSTRALPPLSLGPVAPSARLVKPFDPLAETATIHRHKLLEGIRRSSTMGGLRDRYCANNRRPYSEYFSGNGRVEWDSFIRGFDEQAKHLQQQQRAVSGDSAPTAQVATSKLEKTFDATGEEALAPTHQDPSTVSRVQNCVEQLKCLGFGKEEDGGVGRLVVYAQAANGDLGDAIDMIDEERRVYKERG